VATPWAHGAPRRPGILPVAGAARLKEEGLKMPMPPRPIVWTFAAALSLLIAAPALAVTIKNQDENFYKYSIQEGEYHDEGEVAGNTTTADLCGNCLITIPTIGDFIVSGKQRIVIKGGKATVQ
jgi:hypothetical protein